jgi:sensor histidine kinase YesM
MKNVWLLHKKFFHKPHLLLLLAFGMLNNNVDGQIIELKSNIDFNSITSNIDSQIWDLKASYFIDSLDNRVFEEVKNQKTSPNYTSPNTHTLWCKIVIFNNSPKTNTFYFSIYPMVFKEIFIEPFSMNILKQPAYYFEKFALPISILPNETKLIWFKTSSINFSRHLEPQLLSQKQYFTTTQNRKNSDIKLYDFLYIIIGFLLFTSLFSIVQSIYLKSSTHFFWALYLLTTALAFISELDRAFDVGLFHIAKSKSTLSHYLVEGQFIIHVTYLLFIRSFLDLKTTSKKIYIVIKFANYYNIACFVLFVFFNKNVFFSNEIFVLIANLIILLVAVMLYFSNVKHRKLILIGTTLLLVFGTLSIISTTIINMHNFWRTPFVIYGYGVLLELLFFSIALSQRTHYIQLENIDLQKNYLQNLETELADRIETNQQQNKLLEEQRIKNITSEYEQKIVQTEIKALRAQMNPHFIFNCLNSIQYYTANNQTDQASEYLTKFSKLIRMVLENSRSEKVTLENELETLKLYIEMEAMRFRGKVKYKININEAVDTSDIQIPPLLIQPFVENAIWHGLMHKEEGGEVIIDVSQAQDYLLHIEIIDNGVGREKAMEYKSKSATINKSFGMKVTAERIELINQMYKTNTKIVVLDLKNSENNAIGTKVIVEIPI